MTAREEIEPAIHVDDSLAWLRLWAREQLDEGALFFDAVVAGLGIPAGGFPEPDGSAWGLGARVCGVRPHALGHEARLGLAVGLASRPVLTRQGATQRLDEVGAGA